MIRFGILNLIAGLLQLSVPSYGFRLLRRFGIYDLYERVRS